MEIALSLLLISRIGVNMAIGEKDITKHGVPFVGNLSFDTHQPQWTVRIRNDDRVLFKQTFPHREWDDGLGALLRCIVEETRDPVRLTQLLLLLLEIQRQMPEVRDLALESIY